MLHSDLVSCQPPSRVQMRIPLFKVHLPPREVLMPKLEEVLYSGQIGEGETVKQFESEFGRYIGNPNTLSFSSGTAALHTALILAGVKPGDEVISTPMTAEPTNMAVMHAGAKPVWADIDPESGNIAADSIAEKIGPKTKAIIAVHYAGVPAAIGRIREVAGRHGIPVIEDAAHALGACTRGSYWKSFRICHVFLSGDQASDYSGRWHDRLQRSGGLARWTPRPLVRYRSGPIPDFGGRKEVGYKYHMNNVTAAIGLAQLGVISLCWTGTSKTALTTNRRWPIYLAFAPAGTKRLPNRRTGCTRSWRIGETIWKASYRCGSGMFAGASAKR